MLRALAALSFVLAITGSAQAQATTSGHAATHHRSTPPGTPRTHVEATATIDAAGRVTLTLTAHASRGGPILAVATSRTDAGASRDALEALYEAALRTLGERIDLSTAEIDDLPRLGPPARARPTKPGLTMGGRVI